MQATIDINLKVRRDTTAAWATENPVLADGELGYDKTLKKIKIGDGVTAWAGLAFLTDEVGAAAQSGGGVLVYEKIFTYNDWAAKSGTKAFKYAHGINSPVSAEIYWKFTSNINGFLVGDLLPINSSNVQISLAGNTVDLIVQQISNFSYWNANGGSQGMGLGSGFADWLIRVTGK